ncbi:Leucine-rich repeat [Trinorchestia longiramus]|nr:Leucine-rich repeat [Trinorchestia longiramus]
MPAKVKKTKKKRRMTGLFACLGGCGGKVPRDDIEEITTLDYRHFSLTEVPSDVFACERTLETLYLDSNQLSELPRELFLCHGMQQLSVSDNELSSLPPAIAALSALASLDVSKNNLSSIPDSIKSCRELASVDVSVNPLCKLPEGFTQLIALRELFLNDTFLEYLPANFGRLVSLEVLELRENQLNTLPKSLARLTKLRTLDIGSNEFSQLPEVIGSLSSLQELWFDSNRVRSLAPFLGQLQELTYLDGSNNRIDGLPTEISKCKKLTDLHLTGNHLKTLPDSVSECSALQTLRVDDNALCSLPPDLGNLTHLSQLVVSKNDLEELPPSVGLLRSLHTLHADDNMLARVPSELGSCSSLAILTLASNKLQALPPEIGHLSTLKVLNVCDNNIRNLPVSFSKLKLLALWLSDNQAKPSVQLQTETDPRSGQKVLTCYMLPQQATHHGTEPETSKGEEPFPMATWEEKHRARSIIKFSFDETEPKTGAKLSRAPTPYPKELRALAKHARSLAAGGSKATGSEGVQGRRASHDVIGIDSKEGVVVEEGKRKSAPCVLSVVTEHQQSHGAVTAQYQSAVAEQPPVGINDAVIRTATKTSPSSVMASPSTAQISSSPPTEAGLVAPPVEELPPQLREARALLQSQVTLESKQSPVKKALYSSSSASSSEAPTISQPSSPSSGSAFNAVPADMAERSAASAMSLSSAVNFSVAPTSNSCIVSSVNSPTVTSMNTSVVTTPASPAAANVASPSAPLTTTRPSDDVSDDDATADVLAEALALADHVADAPYKQSSTGDDGADHSSTDSGYCRPSHPTSSQCDLSDQSSELVSPTPSLPSEAVSPVTSGSRHGSLTRASPVHVFSSSPSHNLQYSSKTTLASTAHSPTSNVAAAQPYSSQAHSVYPTATQPGSTSAQAFSSPHHASPYAPGSPVYASHYVPVSPRYVATPPQHSPHPIPITPNSPFQHLTPAERAAWTDGRLTPHGTNIPELGGDATTRVTYFPSSASQPRPGSLALSSLAESGVLSDRAGYLARPGSLAAPCNTLGIPPAPPTRAVSASTGLNHTSRLVKQDSGSSLKSPNSTGHSYAISSEANSVYSSMSNSKIMDNSSMPYQNTDLPPHTGSDVRLSSGGGCKYSSPQTRIPINRQFSSSSISNTKDASRIPSYTLQHSAKMSADLHSRAPQPVNADGNSCIPSLLAAGRTNSNLSMKSNISTISTSSNHAFNNRPNPADVYRSGNKESRIPSVAEATNHGNGARSSLIPSSDGKFFPTNMSSPPGGVAIISPSYNSPSPKGTGIPSYSSPSMKTTGIPAPGYTRSGSSAELSDCRASLTNNSSSFGKSGVPVSSSNSKSSRLPLSLNSSFESSREYKTSPPSRKSGSGSHGSSSGSLSPVNEAINMSGLPSPPVAEQQQQQRPSGLQQPKVSSRIPLLGAISPTSTNAAVGRGPPLTTAPAQAPPSQRATKGRSPGQSSGWMFGSHQNARVWSGHLPQRRVSKYHTKWYSMLDSFFVVLSAQCQLPNSDPFPVIVEKQPSPGFTVTLGSEPEKSVVVSYVERDGPASAALQTGDKILQVDGASLAGATAEDVLAFMEPNGDTLSLLVSRPR